MGRFDARKLSTAAEFQAAFALRAAVYVDQEQFLTEDCLIQGLERDEIDHLCWHGGVFRNGELAATARLIPADSVELPVFSEFGCEVADAAVEISRFLVNPKYRATTALLELCALIIRRLEEEAIENVYAVVEEWFFDLVVAIGFPFQKIGEPQFTYNSWNLPIHCRTCDLIRGVQAADESRRRPLAPILFAAEALVA